jgi:hypothetical protein
MLAQLSIDEQPAAARMSSAFPRPRVGQVAVVATVMRRGVAAQLAANGRRCPADLLGDLPDTEALAAQRGDAPPTPNHETRLQTHHSSAERERMI